MFKPRNTIVLILGLVLGCNFIPPEFSQLFPLDTAVDPQAVQDVTSSDISDPNAAALNSPAAQNEPVRVRLSNPTDRDADCAITMDLIGHEVHLTTRRIIASTESLVIGPDRADTILIEVTFLGDPAVEIEPTILRIYQDYQPGDTIEYVLALPADDDDQSSDDPPLPPRTGACCYPDGTCVVTTEEMCEGEYQGDDTSCDPNPCPRPVGACCLSGGPCEITTEDECTDGIWLGEDTTCEECPECLVICPADATDENEPCGEDTNGGCYSYPQQFTPIACDETICATSWSDFFDPNEPNDPNIGRPNTLSEGCSFIAPTSRRGHPNNGWPNTLSDGVPLDIDWYELTFDEPTEFTFTVATEFPIFVMLMEQYIPGAPGCENLTGDVADMAFSIECGLLTLSRCVESGTYYMLVNPAFEYLEGYILDCEGQNHYTATLTCEPCDYVAACCVEGDCIDNTSESDCLDQGGTWHYWDRCPDFVCPPVNDDCENAIQIGEVSDLAFDTSAATHDYPNDCMYSPNIWYCYTATQTGPMVISLCGSTYDTMLGVYHGCDCEGEMSLIECNDDTDECGLQSQIIIDAYAEQTYMIEIGGYSFYSGAGILNIHPLPGACCVDYTCVYTNTLSECNDLGGTWYAGEDCCASFPCPPPCPESEITITIVTDGFPSEITWEIFDPNSAEPVCFGGPFEYANTPYIYTCCIGAEDCVDFTIYDSFGDGMDAPGGYSIALDGVVLHDCIGSGWGGGEGNYEETFANIGGGCIIYGACCAWDGTCLVLTESDCYKMGGTYMGDGEECEPNPCLPPYGACCVGDGVCQMMTDVDCYKMGGDFLGDGVECEPINPCPQP